MDKRIINTKKKLTNNLLLLLSEKNINNITVLELCKKADINRTTFYKYYKDIDDLVGKIEESLLVELSKSINDIKRNYLITYTSNVIKIISNHKELYMKLLGVNGDHLFLRRILGQVYNESIQEWKKLLKKASENDIENIYNFIVDGTIGTIENWIGNNCKDNPESIALFVNKICMSGLSSFI